MTARNYEWMLHCLHIVAKVCLQYLCNYSTGTLGYEMIYNIDNLGV